MSINPTDITAHVRHNYEPDDVVEIRCINGEVVRSHWFYASETAAIIHTASRQNEAGMHVYVGTLPRIDKGHRGSKGVSLARVVWADFDGKHLTTTAGDEQVAEVLTRIANAWLPAPTMIVHSGHGVHAYWRLAAPVTDLDRFAELLDCLVGCVNSDNGAKGLDRIMRLAGTINVRPPVAPARLIYVDPHHIDIDDIEQAVYHSNHAAPIDPAVMESAEKLIGSREPRAEGHSIIDAFNQSVGIRDLLTSYGYDVVGTRFRRPGKTDRGFSGIIRRDRLGRDVSAHWSTNDPLNDRRFPTECGLHDAFSAYTLAEHRGDAKAAVKAAAAILNPQKARPS